MQVRARTQTQAQTPTQTHTAPVQLSIRHPLHPILQRNPLLLQPLHLLAFLNLRCCSLRRRRCCALTQPRLKLLPLPILLLSFGCRCSSKRGLPLLRFNRTRLSLLLLLLQLQRALMPLPLPLCRPPSIRLFLQHTLLCKRVGGGGGG